MFPTYTGSDGGSGQGSLAISTITNDFFDYQTSNSQFGSSGRSSDGNGGLLIASIEGDPDTVSLRRLTAAGKDTTFAGDGTAEVSILPTGRFVTAPEVGWYGTSRDKWVLLMSSNPSFNSVGSSTQELLWGDFGSGSVGSAVIGTDDVSVFCASVIQDKDNLSTSYS